MSEWFTTFVLARALLVVNLSWRDSWPKDGRHTGVAPPFLALHLVLCALIARAIFCGRLAPGYAAPSLPQLQSPPVASLQIYVCHGARTCEPHSWACGFLVHRLHFPQRSANATTIWYEIAAGKCTSWASAGVKCRTLEVGTCPNPSWLISLWSK